MNEEKELLEEYLREQNPIERLKNLLSPILNFLQILKEKALEPKEQIRILEKDLSACEIDKIKNYLHDAEYLYLSDQKEKDFLINYSYFELKKKIGSPIVEVGDSIGQLIDVWEVDEHVKVKVNCSSNDPYWANPKNFFFV